MHNFLISNGDTDSLTFYKQDESSFGKEEREKLLKEINSIFPDGLVWEDDGYFPCMIVLKAKNYVLKDESGKVKIKGAALKATTKEPALKEFINKILDSILNDREDFKEIYESYVQEILDVKDIRRWSSKKTLSNVVMESERKNETQLVEAIEGTEYKEGDKFYVFYDKYDKVTLVEKFDSNYSKARLLEKLYDTAFVFDTVLVTEELFTNYALLKHFKQIDPEQAEIRRNLGAEKRKLATEKRILRIRAAGGNI